MKKLYFVFAIVIIMAMIVSVSGPSSGPKLTFYERGTCSQILVNDTFIDRLGATIGGASLQCVHDNGSP
jgi:hypothetical protein